MLGSCICVLGSCICVLDVMYLCVRVMYLCVRVMYLCVRVMYLCVMGMDFASFYDFYFLFWNCYDNVVCFVFHFNTLWFIYFLSSVLSS